MPFVDRVGYPMETRDLFLFRVAELNRAPLHKDPETGVLTVEKSDYDNGSAIFFQAHRNGHGETVTAAITNFNKATNKLEPNQIVLENAHFRSDRRGGLIIASQTPQGEIGVKIPLGAPPEVYQSVGNLL